MPGSCTPRRLTSRPFGLTITIRPISCSPPMSLSWISLTKRAQLPNSVRMLCKTYGNDYRFFREALYSRAFLVLANILRVGNLRHEGTHEIAFCSHSCPGLGNRD